jgi:hypothetical protein
MPDCLLPSICKQLYLDAGVRLEAVELVEELQHGPLHLAVTRLLAARPGWELAGISYQSILRSARERRQLSLLIGH